MARLNPSAKIYGIDYIPGLVSLTRENLMKGDRDLLDNGNGELLTKFHPNPSNVEKCFYTNPCFNIYV